MAYSLTDKITTYLADHGIEGATIIAEIKKQRENAA